MRAIVADSAAPADVAGVAAWFCDWVQPPAMIVGAAMSVADGENRGMSRLIFGLFLIGL
jgi:hypothetical protein